MLPFAQSRRVLFTALLIILLAPTAQAEPQVVNNSKDSAQGVVQAGLKELWRAGGEDDDIFFGTLAGVRTDNDGNLYLLDGQLAQVHMYTPEGEHLGTVCREGDGPGEVRRPSDMFVTSDGIINVIQGFPGRIVKVSADGMPAGEAAYGAGEASAGQFGVLVGGRSDGQDMVLAGIRMTFGGAVSKQTYFLARCDNDGQQKFALLEKEHEINYSDFALDEMEMDFIWNRFAVGPKGKVYAGPERNEYKIHVYATDGTIEKVITREYKSGPRTQEQRQLATQIIEAVAANYPAPPKAITIEKTQQVLSNIQVTEDGRIWTQTASGDAQAPEGCWIVMDVFSPDGKFEKQVALKGDHNASHDAVNLLPDGKVIVIVGALDAWLNQQGAGASDEEAEESEPIEIICYQLDW